MATLYISSIEGEVGKTALALGLALEARERGLRVGYLKPVGVNIDTTDGTLVEIDAALMRNRLGLSEPVDVLCPVLLTEVLRRETIGGRTTDAATAIKTAYGRVSQGKDLIIAESPRTPSQGITLSVEPPRVAEMTDAKVLLILRGDYTAAAEPALMARSLFGSRLLGVVMNAVPFDMIEETQRQFGSYLKRQGIELLGVLPHDPVLGAFTVGELATLLGGHLITIADAMNDLVESFSIGAMGVEAALRYFMRQANKAVITGGDRTDIIAAALETPTRCVILTGNLMPEQAAINHAIERKVPLMVVPLDTLDTVRKIEEARNSVRLSTPEQIDRLRQLVRQGIDVDALVGRLGIRRRAA